ncbi:substrate-binding domain-containing protein [uncultured Friedmanniella sp.]|uniref:substrate-binding domain-containing protein n=1 Tax=uncultured Friedmanniella sp. TaxID=335381 RepID=UPI0035CB2CF0
MRRPVMPLAGRIGVALVGTGVSYGICLLLGASAGSALGVSGFVFGLLTFLLSELKELSNPVKRIWYIGQEDAVFNDNIRRGLETTLDGALRYRPEPALPPHDVVDVLGWQRGLLESVRAGTYDAVVILPARDDARLWNRLADLAEKGASVVVIDVEPAWDTFLDRGVTPPVFVSSDFAEGGRLAGGLVADALEARPGSHGLVAIGPSSSSAGAGRSAWILYALAQRHQLDRIRAHELSGWQTDAASSALATEVEALLGAGSSEVVVFCGDDRIMSALSRTVASDPGWTSRVWLVGYDGTTDAAGRYLARQEQHCCIGSVDTEPTSQGRDAAKALLEAYQQPAQAARRRWMVKPRALTPGNWN